MNRIIVTTPHDEARGEVEQQGDDLYPVYHFNGLYYGVEGYDDLIAFYADQARLAEVANKEGARVLVFGATEPILRVSALEAAAFLLDTTSVEAVILATATIPDAGHTRVGFLKITNAGLEILLMRNLMPVSDFWMDLAHQARQVLRSLPDLEQVA